MELFQFLHALSRPDMEELSTGVLRHPVPSLLVLGMLLSIPCLCFTDQGPWPNKSLAGLQHMLMSGNRHLKQYIEDDFPAVLENLEEAKASQNYPANPSGA